MSELKAQEGGWGPGLFSSSLARVLARSTTLPARLVIKELKRALNVDGYGAWEAPVRVAIPRRGAASSIKAKLHVLNAGLFTYEMLELRNSANNIELMFISIYQSPSGLGLQRFH